MQLREHQIECINNINKHFENDTKALVKMFCGSGKSYIIYHCLLKYTKDLSVIVVPSINLVSQFIKDYLLKYDNNYKLLSICSKNEVDKHLDFTTDEDDIYDFIINNESKIIIITYQSFELLLNIIKENEFEIDLICFDEAHHIVSHNMKKLLFDYDEDDEDDIYENFIDLYCNKTLFFTATPKNHNSIMMYEPYVTDNFEFIDDDNSCITEEPHCGKMIYEYMHINGVNYNILNDFNIMIDLYTENTDNNIFEAISRSILQTGNNRVLTFHSSVIKTNKGSNVLDFINEELFIKCFNKILNTEFSHLENKYKSIIFNGITANTKNKLKILEQFDNTKDNEIYILASCKTIGEGVDTKNANMVVFIDPKQSYVEIIQNIGRVCRKNENTKQLATILLPIYVDVNKYKECNTEDEQNKVIMDEMSKTGDFTMILNVLTALRQEDPYIFELCINLPNVFTDKEINDTIKKSNLKLKDKEYSNIKLFKSYNLEYNNNLNEIDNFNNLSKSLENNINIVNQVIENTDININNNYDKTINFIKTENNTYKKVKGDNILTRPNRNIKPKYNLNDELKILWKIEGNINLDKKIFCGYINSTIKLSNEEEWLKKLKEVEEYIIKNNKRPKYNDKNNDIKKLGTWLSHQINNYKNNRSIMKNKKYKQLFKKFLNEYKYIFPDNIEIWCNNLEKLKEFINKNYRLPLENNKINGERHLRLWLYKQQKNYYNKIGIMKVQVIYNKWLTFINEYKEYLLNYEVKWYNNFNKLIKFINENNRLPSKNNDEKHLIGWLSSQKYNYKLKKESMSNINIYEEWSKFINEYKGYLLNNEEKWYNNLNKVKKFIDKNTKTPSGISKNRDEQLLGKWLTAQKKNYKSKIHIMKNKYIYDEYTLFTDDYKKYLLDNEEIWYNKLEELEEFINKNNKIPYEKAKNNDEKQLGIWLSVQKRNYKNKIYSIKDGNIRETWEEFINKYKEYLFNYEEKWYNNFNKLKNFIIKYNKLPSSIEKNDEIKQLGKWLSMQKDNYKNNKNSMKNNEIRIIWEDFLDEYKDFFLEIKTPSKKSTIIKPKSTEDKTEKINKNITKTEYQKISKLMTSQTSKNTYHMFKKDGNLWHTYHNERDFSYQGYDNQNDIPINKIINYLETKKNYKIKILDLGCGRNKIAEHFKDDTKLNITGYDYISFNNSIECNIKNLPDEDESINICIFSLALMGFDWKDYIKEAIRVLIYNGEIIIAESCERYATIKEYLEELNIKIIIDDYKENNRWFIVHGIKN